MVGSLWRRLKASSYWKDVAWLVSGTLVAQAMIFASYPLFTRLYRPTDFAVANLFSQIVVLVSVLTTVRYECFVQIPRRHGEGWHLVQLVGALALLAFLVLTPIGWFFRATFARWAGEPRLAPWVVFIPVTAALTSLAAAFQGWEQRRRRFRRSSEAEVAAKVGYVGSTLAGYFLLPGSGGLVLGSNTFAMVGKLAWLVRIGRKRLAFDARDLRAAARKLGRLAGSLTLSQALLAVTNFIPLLFIAHAYGPEVLGQFSLALQAVYLPTALVGNATSSVYYQRASARWAQGQSFSGLWRSTVLRLLLIGLPAYGAATVLLPTVFPVVFGGKWVIAGRYAGILAISSFFGFVASPIEKGCLVVGAWWYIPLWHATRTLSNAVLAFLALTRGWGINTYLIGFTALSGLMYGIDFWAETLFAFQHPPAPGEARPGDADPATP